MSLLRTLVLVSETVTVDSIGQPITTLTERSVMAELRSITQSEFYQGRQGGLSPELSFKMSQFDYQGEQTCIYSAQRYHIYRTYIADENTIELYCEREVGVTNVE